MTHGAARVCGRRTEKMTVDARTKGGMGGYDRGNPKYNGANHGWKRLRYINIDYRPMYGAYESNSGSRGGQANMSGRTLNIRAHGTFCVDY